MAVIAKLLPRGITNFGTGTLVELGCVCDNDLMAAYAGSEEDKLFTRYSPWGEMKINVAEGWSLLDVNWSPGDVGPPPAFYAIALQADEHEFSGATGSAFEPDRDFPGAAAWVYGSCPEVCMLGGESSRVTFRGGNRGTVKGRGIEAMHWKMSVDNPAATAQFKPGANYWIVLYPADKFDRDAAIRAALGHPALTDVDAGA